MSLPNWRMPTAGGKVWWYTLDNRRGFKLQQNKLTSHFRILDPSDCRVDWDVNETSIRDSFYNMTRD